MNSPDANRPNRPTRRDFLTGRAGVDALGDLADRLTQADNPAHDRTDTAPKPTGAAADAPVAATDPDPATPPRPQAGYLTRYGRRAMACEFEVVVPTLHFDTAAEAAIEALDLVEQLEQQMTIYRESSDLQRVNSLAAQQSVVVEEPLFAVLQIAQQLAETTGGAIDITSGPLNKLWGFAQKEHRVPGEAELQNALAQCGYHYLQLDAATQSVRFLRPGMQLNLGSIGKGFALDRMAELLSAVGVESFLLHGGQSSVLARGQSPAGSGSWSVGIAHPRRVGQRLGQLHLVDQALGTSGSAVHYFRQGGRRYGHIIDPRTGQPGEQMLAATVLAPTAAEADALATALFVMGVDKAHEFVAAHGQLGAVLVYLGANRSRYRVAVLGVAEQQWEPEATLHDESDLERG